MFEHYYEGINMALASTAQIITQTRHLIAYTHQGWIAVQIPCLNKQARSLPIVPHRFTQAQGLKFDVHKIFGPPPLRLSMLPLQIRVHRCTPRTVITIPACQGLSRK